MTGVIHIGHDISKIERADSRGDRIEKGDKLALDGIRETIENGGEAVLKNETKGESYKLCYSFSGRQKDIILAGGLLNYTRESHK